MDKHNNEYGESFVTGQEVRITGTAPRLAKSKYGKLLEEMAKLSRKEGIVYFANWIKENGTFYEARACEVAGEMRTKRINAERISNGENDRAELKRSLSVRRMKGIIYLVEKSGTNKPKLIGRTLPENYDLSQVSVSEEAEKYINS